MSASRSGCDILFVRSALPSAFDRILMWRPSATFGVRCTGGVTVALLMIGGSVSLVGVRSGVTLLLGGG